MREIEMCVTPQIKLKCRQTNNPRIYVVGGARKELAIIVIINNSNDEQVNKDDRDTLFSQNDTLNEDHPGHI